MRQSCLGCLASSARLYTSPFLQQTMPLGRFAVVIHANNRVLAQCLVHVAADLYGKFSGGGELKKDTVSKPH